jgi:hypothetical protein
VQLSFGDIAPKAVSYSETYRSVTDVAEASSLNNSQIEGKRSSSQTASEYDKRFLSCKCMVESKSYKTHNDEMSLANCIAKRQLVIVK